MRRHSSDFLVASTISISSWTLTFARMHAGKSSRLMKNSFCGTENSRPPTHRAFLTTLCFSKSRELDFKLGWNSTQRLPLKMDFLREEPSRWWKNRFNLSHSKLLTKQPNTLKIPRALIEHAFLMISTLVLEFSGRCRKSHALGKFLWQNFKPKFMAILRSVEDWSLISLLPLDWDRFPFVIEFSGEPGFNHSGIQCRKTFPTRYLAIPIYAPLPGNV